jgi:hypothetical protein
MAPEAANHANCQCRESEQGQHMGWAEAAMLKDPQAGRSADQVATRQNCPSQFVGEILVPAKAQIPENSVTS